MNTESLITDLAFILLLGAVVTVLFKWIKQPVVLGYIVAGFLASPHFEYLPSVTSEENIDFWAEIGIVVLLFSLGLEFSFKKLLNSGYLTQMFFMRILSWISESQMPPLANARCLLSYCAVKFCLPT